MKIKRIFSLLLAAVLGMAGVAGLSGCANKGYGIPIVCGENGMNAKCGIATYGVDYYRMGVTAGNMAADILLEGADISKMAVQTDPDPALTVNTDIAQALGFTIPQAVLDRVPQDKENEVTRVESAIVASGADFTVGILQLVQHEALDAANKGFQDQLSVRMSEKGKTVTIQDRNASNDQSNNVTIAQTFVTQNVDLIYTIATSSSQAAVSATAEKKIPVLFNAVTDPVGEGLVASMTEPGGNVSGVSDINPVAKQLDLIKELLGKDQIKIGFLYTSAESNSVYQVNIGTAYCNTQGYSYVEKGIGDINDIQSAFIALHAEGVDAIYIPTDNTLANGAANIHMLNIGG